MYGVHIRGMPGYEILQEHPSVVCILDLRPSTWLAELVEEFFAASTEYGTNPGSRILRGAYSYLTVCVLHTLI